jgi:hypothetical protein
VSNWSLAAGTRSEVLGNPGTGEGTTVTTGVANTKGSYADLGTATFAYAGMVLMVSSVSGARVRLDLAVDTGGGNQIVVEDLFMDFTGGGIAAAVHVVLPIHVPSGATIRARAQSNGSGISLRAMLIGYAMDTPGFSRVRQVKPLNAWGGSAASATDPASFVALTGNTYTAWTEVTASAPDQCFGLLVALGNNGATARGNTRIVVDIGVGGAGSEVLIGTIMVGQTANGPGAMSAMMPVHVAAGSRVAFRLVTSGAAFTQTTGCSVHGLIP